MKNALSLVVVAIVVAFVTVVAVGVSSHSGPIAPNTIVSSSQPQCDFGYHYVGKRAQGCTVRTFTVSSNQTLWGFATMLGDPTQVSRLCVGDEQDGVFVGTPADDIDPRELAIGKLVEVCA